MKIIELGSGLRTVVSNEENLLLCKIRDAGGRLARGQLSERERVLAMDLVKKGVLTRLRAQDKLYYQVDDPDKVWRI